MDIQKLKYFYTVSKLEHITKASEELHISQPSLTQAMHLLERELGVPLFKKQGRRIALTEFGVYLKQKLETLLPEFDNLPNQLNQLKNVVNKTVKLNILAASTFVINSIMRYKKNNPGVIFDFEQSEVKSDCDILITTNGAKSNRQQAPIKRCVKEEQIFIAVPKESSLAEHLSVNLEQLKDENFIMLSSSRLFGVICNKFCSSAGFTPKILFESDSPSAVQNIISMGTGVSFWPEHSWGKIRNKNTILLPVSPQNCKRDLIFELYDKRPTSKYAKDFYNFLLKQI